MRTYSHQQGRDENIKLLFDLISCGGIHTRAELSRVTQLSPSTVSSLVEELIRDGLVTEGGLAKLPSRAGRRAITLEINAEGRHIPVFSLDLRGVNYTLFDLKYNVLEQYFHPFQPEKQDGCQNWNQMESMPEAGEAYAAIIEDILSNHTERFDSAKAIGVLVSYPGIFLEEENLFLLTSMEVGMKREAFEQLGNRIGLPVYLGNSSVNLAYAEKKMLDEGGSGVADLIYVNICDGVGAGIIFNGEVFAHPNLITSELGHIIVEQNGRRCPCGNRGCLERYVNVNAIREAVHAAMVECTPNDISLKEIGNAFGEGVPEAVAALDSVASRLAMGIGAAISITGIKCIVIGGVADLGDKFLDMLHSRLHVNASNVLLRGVQLMYSHAGAYADSVGLAKYYIDKVFTIRNSN